ncbi:MAG: response regulator transcription factor [Planctomycetota bacterium]|nr:response regulator transcription factor [Planctomycetota bacterium]MDG1984502.1 response regulator transcription factor [Planctomycetota bacterium]
MKILVVEDNPKMARSVEMTLTESGFDVETVDTVSAAKVRAAEQAYDLFLLDLMLPDGDGIELCGALRASGIASPIMMLTALSGTSRKVAGLDSGADDYLTKPFEVDELVARVRALLRRGVTADVTRLKYGDVEMDLTKRTVQRAGTKVAITTKEFALLEFLVRNPGETFTRSTITERVWDMSYEPSSNVVDVYISNLRRKLDKPFETKLIHTVVGTGYRFGAADD